jgi:hypothetical protein
MEFIYNKVKLYNEDFEEHREYHKYVHDSISEEITDIYRKDNDKNYETFLEEHFELVKDANDKLFEKNKLFEKYNSTMDKYMSSYYCFIKLCILKKNFLGIEKDTCVFVNVNNKNKLILFYVKYNNKNIELAKKIWLDNLNFGNYSREKYRSRYFLTSDKIIINDKEEYIFKELEIKSKIEIEILVQEKITITEK